MKTIFEKGYITFDEGYNILLEYGISEETLNTVCNIIGNSVESLEKIIYSQFGYNSFEQLLNEY